MSQPVFAAACGALLLALSEEELDIRTRTSVGLSAVASGSGVIELPAGLDAGVLVVDADALTKRQLAWSQAEYLGIYQSGLAAMRSTKPIRQVGVSTAKRDRAALGQSWRRFQVHS
ncbi:hypothetical protein ABFA25_04035 [Mycobacterium lepromatosis]